MNKLFGLIFVLILIKINYNTIQKDGSEKFNNDLLNIYDEPLEPCRENKMYNGSWDNKGKCSELGGGVHQICVKNIANNAKEFSKITGQSNWSDNRGINNHCVCLGAWSLYNSKKDNKNKILKCDSIPKVALSKNYVSKFSEGWNKWNGLELSNQIIDGVEGLMNNCYLNDKKSKNLKKNYCNLAKDVNVLKDRDLYKKLCQ